MTPFAELHQRGNVTSARIAFITSDRVLTAINNTIVSLTDISFIVN